MGRTYVVFGKSGTAGVSLADLPDANGGFFIDGEAELDAAGITVGGAGDVNGDGLADLLVGTSRLVGINGGKGYVIFGKADTAAVSLADVPDGTGGFVLDSGASAIGASLSAAGDVNRGRTLRPHHGRVRGDVWWRVDLAEPRGLREDGHGGRHPLSHLGVGPGGFTLQGELSDNLEGLSVSGAGGCQRRRVCRPDRRGSGSRPRGADLRRVRQGGHRRWYPCPTWQMGSAGSSSTARSTATGRVGR